MGWEGGKAQILALKPQGKPVSQPLLALSIPFPSFPWLVHLSTGYLINPTERERRVNNEGQRFKSIVGSKANLGGSLHFWNDLHSHRMIRQLNGRITTSDWGMLSFINNVINRWSCHQLLTPRLLLVCLPVWQLRLTSVLWSCSYTLTTIRGTLFNSIDGSNQFLIRNHVENSFPELRFFVTCWRHIYPTH